MGEDSFNIGGFDLNAFLNAAGDDPVTGFYYIFIHGGWIIFLYVAWIIARMMWLEWRQGLNVSKKQWMLLRIQVPKATEQTPRAMENMFAHFAGAHSPTSWTERWIGGNVESAISLEIASLEGRVQFFIRFEKRLRNFIESAIYAQYPDAEIEEAEDYTKLVPHHWPDEDWDFYGTEMIPVKDDAYSLKTYPEFEDAVSGEFKDPLAAVLENFSHIGRGEYVWYQIVITPTDQKDARARAEKVLNKLKGIKVEAKKTTLDHIIDIPIKAVETVFDAVLGIEREPPKKKDEKSAFPKLMSMTKGEQFIIESIERKAGKIGFLTKIRFAYAGKKTVFQKARALQPFIGAIKQMNTFHMQALKPESKHVGINATLWWFKDARNNHRRNHFLHAYMGRSNWSGITPYMLSSEELATLWHFPILTQVKAPSLDRTAAKKTDAPFNIPFSDEE